MSQEFKNKIILGLRWTTAFRFIGQGIKWCITLLIMRILSPDDYGLVSLSGIFIDLISLSTELGLGASIIQMQSITSNILRQIFSFSIILNIIIYIISWVAIPHISMFLGDIRLTPIIRITAIQIFLTSFIIIPQSLLMRDMEFKKLSLIEMICSIMSSVSSLAFAFYGFGVWSLVYGALVLNLTKIICLWFVRPFFGFSFIKFSDVKKMLSFGGTVTLTRIIWYIYQQSDIFLVGKFLGSHILGYYSMAFTLASIPIAKISSILNQIAFPAFSKTQHDINLALQRYIKSVGIICVIFFPICWGMSCVAPEMLRLFLGPQWSSAIIPFQIICISVPLRICSGILNSMLTGLGYPQQALKNMFMNIIVIPLAILYALNWGIIGVSVVWITVWPLVFMYNIYSAMKLLGGRVSKILYKMFSPLISSAVMYFYVYSLRNFFTNYMNIYLELIFLMCSGAIIYLLSLLMLDKNNLINCISILRPVRDKTN